jgi:hypothetical protein
LSFVWFISCLAETNRTPFDFAEGESEIVSGFIVVYGGGEGVWLIFLAAYSSILFMGFVIALRDCNVIKVSLSMHAVKFEKFFIDSLREQTIFLRVYVRFTRQDQVAIPTDVWIPLGCFVTTHCRQSLLSSPEDKDKFVSDPNSALRRVSDGVLDENECSTLSSSRFASWEISRYSLNRRLNTSQCLSVCLYSLEKRKISCCCTVPRLLIL